MKGRRSLALTHVLVATSLVLSFAHETRAQGIRGLLQQRMQQQQQQNQGQAPAQNQPQGQMPPGQAPNGGMPNGIQASGMPDVSVVNLQTQRGANGQQMVVTPKGFVVPLPGAGVNSPAVPIYIGGNGGYWYVDKFGQQVDLTPAVQAYQAHISQMAPQNIATPQYAPPPQTTIVNNNGSGSSGSSAAGTGVAAGVGAMTGAIIGNAMYDNNSNPYYGVPYGTAMHYNAAGAPYYNQGGKPVYVNNSTNAEFNQANAYHANAMQQQQQWYHQQQAQQTEHWKNWQQQSTANNPFVRSENANAQNLTQQAPQARGADADQGGRRGRRHRGDNSAQVDQAAGARDNDGGRRGLRGDGGGRGRRFGRN